MTNQRLKEYCDAEFENINAVVSEIFSLIKTEETRYSLSELAAIATFIHNFYNGLENILKKVVASKQIEIKESPTWHKDLLKSAMEEKIISPELYHNLANYLSFRHFFRHAYSFNLRWEDLKVLVDSIKDTLTSFKSAISSSL